MNHSTKVTLFTTVPLLFSKKEKEKIKRSKCILYFYVRISDWFLSTTETLPTLKSLVVSVLFDDALYAHCFQILPKVRNFHDRKRKRRYKRGKKKTKNNWQSSARSSSSYLCTMTPINLLLMFRCILCFVAFYSIPLLNVSFFFYLSFLFYSFA